MSMQKYSERYANRFETVFQEKPTNWSYRDATVFTTWAITLEHIKRKNLKAAKLFFLCSMLSNENIWETMLRRGLKLSEDGTLYSLTVELVWYDCGICAEGYPVACFIPKIAFISMQLPTIFLLLEKISRAALLLGSSNDE